MASRQMGSEKLMPDAIPPIEKDLNNKVQEKTSVQLLNEIFDKCHKEAIRVHTEELENIKKELLEKISRLRIDFKKCEEENLKLREQNSQCLDQSDQLRKLEDLNRKLATENQRLADQNRQLQDNKMELEKRCELLEKAAISQKAEQEQPHGISFQHGDDQPDSSDIPATGAFAKVVPANPEIDKIYPTEKKLSVRMEIAEVQCSSNRGKLEGDSNSAGKDIRSDAVPFLSDKSDATVDQKVCTPKKFSEMQKLLQQQQEYKEFLSRALSANNWQPVLRSMEVSDNMLADIRHDHPNNAFTQRYEAFKLWFEQEGVKATPHRIINALMSNKLRAVAEEFCSKFNLPDLFPIKDKHDSVHAKSPSHLPKNSKLTAVNKGGDSFSSSKQHFQAPSGQPLSGTTFDTSIYADVVYHPSSYIPPGRVDSKDPLGLNYNPPQRHSSPVHQHSPQVMHHPSSYIPPGRVDSKDPLGLNYNPPQRHSSPVHQHSPHALHHPSSYIPPGRVDSKDPLGLNYNPPQRYSAPVHQHSPHDAPANPLLRVLSAHIKEGRNQNFQEELSQFPVNPSHKAHFFDSLQKKDQIPAFQKKLKVVSKNEFPNWLELLDGWAAAIESCEVDTTKPFNPLWDVRQVLLSLERQKPCMEIERVFTKNLLSGALGPIQDPKEKITKIRWLLKRDIIHALSGTPEGVVGWKELADHLQYGSHIPLWAEERKGPENCLKVIGTKNMEIGNLYVWMLNNERLDIVELMESRKYLEK